MAIAVFAGLGAHQAQAQLGRALISGIVPCSTGNLINAATAPVFPSKIAGYTAIPNYCGICAFTYTILD